ncbi:hypothetical protein U9M48_033836 [Paspalum notatum var. saurae]|uniref:SWIM-type domain-containing protein n=1 Tax=Paspalum notatum var. saurae TaxID=547442 RepID=A0AAQ3U7W5_PASNO
MVTPGQSPDTSWLPAGMDPDSSYLLKIRLTGNPKKSRKDFSCFKITKPTTSEPIEPTTSEPIVDDDDGYLANPQPQNEHVGVDDEGLYLTTHKAVSEPIVDDDDGYLANPPMDVGSIYPNMQQFRLALSQHAIKHEFEFDTAKSDPGRLRAYCSRKKEEVCRWRLHASMMKDNKTIKVKKNPRPHKCTSARRSKNVKNATKFWICEQVKYWLMEDSRVGPKKLQWRIKDKYNVQLPYKRVFDGKCLAQTELFGSWDSSFDNLFRFKKEVERSCLGSSVVIDHHTIEGKIRFNRLFFAMKPCIDGFLNGCRPYLAIDSTFLTGRFRGQLACAVAVDGHNWMYPVAVGVIDSETNENWSWFMHRLRDVIGIPEGLAICTDAGAAVMEGVKEVFPTAEHRECMLHLVMNFKKRYTRKIFDDHLWVAAYSWSPYFFEKLWKAMDEAKPEAMDYIRRNHTRIWARSQFWTHCKVDYITNNLAEYFNNWIKKYKGMKELKEQSHNLDMDVQRSGDAIAEVSVKCGSGYKCVVKLDARTCSCKKWELTGIPCKHAIAFITSLREPLEKYVDMCYSTQKFKVAYETLILAMPDKNQWPKSDHGFFMHPPLLKSIAERRHNKRFKGCMETGGSTTKRKGSHQCPICKNYGHRWYNCKNGDPEDIAAMLAMRGPPKKKKKKSEPSCESTILPVDSVPKAMHFPPRSAHGSNQPELFSIEYLVQSLGQTTPPPATSMPTKEKKKATGRGKKRKFQCYLIVQQCLLGARHLRGKVLLHTRGAKENFQT